MLKDCLIVCCLIIHAYIRARIAHAIAMNVVATEFFRLDLLLALTYFHPSNCHKETTNYIWF